MRVLLLNTSEKTGGAAIAANRLLQALLKNKIDARMLVAQKQTEDKNVSSVADTPIRKLRLRFNFLWERLIIYIHNQFNKKNLFKVSLANTGFDISSHPDVIAADIIHLHWINQGFLSLKNIHQLLSLNKPIVWTMHDMWPCTGICHHAGSCRKYKEKCGDCPLLLSSTEKDLSYKTLRKKKNLLYDSIKFVAVSSWLAQLAQKSALVKNAEVFTIPNGIDISLFQMQDKAFVRRKYFLPEGKKIILMGAARLDDPIKGLDNLKHALSLLLSDFGYQKDELILAVFGKIRDKKKFEENLPVPYVSFDLVSDTQKINDFYSLADVTVVPSYYETFGQTIIESMACATPVVTFNNSGQTDIIDHLKNGYLANCADNQDFAYGIDWAFQNRENQELKEKCVKKVQTTYADSAVVEEYISLYKKLL